MERVVLESGKTLQIYDKIMRIDAFSTAAALLRPGVVTSCDAKSAARKWIKSRRDGRFGRIVDAERLVRGRATGDLLLLIGANPFACRDDSIPLAGRAAHG